jgi:L-arabinose isomerase
VEFRIKQGPITLLSLGVSRGGRFKFVIAEGQSLRGPIPPTGNTNTRGFFQPDVRTFLKRWVAEGPTHHFAIGTGNEAGVIKQIGEILGLETAIVATGAKKD